jgi:hypothetical protein
VPPLPQRAILSQVSEGVVVSESRRNTGPKEPSMTTIKRLFAESGNLCAFPKCAQPILHGRTVIGDVCHIKAKSPDGPRYDPEQSDEERHRYDNLILLCGVHHTVVDSDEISYTVERLKAMKAAHRAKAAHLPDEVAEDGAILLFSNPVVSVNQSGGIRLRRSLSTITVESA